MSAVPASGAQFSLFADGYEVDVASVGASLRGLRYHGRDLVVPFGADEVRPAMRGALLLPWPNRTADGRYEFDGVVHHLAINEPETMNAAHGLVSWLNFEPLVDEPSALRLAAILEPQPGYPWRLRVVVDFTLSPRGLTQEVTAINLSTTTAPVGIGGHPYLLAGPVGVGAVDEWELEVPADQVLLVSADRMLPTELIRVASSVGTAYDFRRARRIGGIVLNNAYTSLRSEANGTVRVRVRNAGGQGVELHSDARATWMQLYTSDAGVGDAHRHALAVEPMTCPPGALNSHSHYARVHAGAATGLSWTIRSIG